MKKKNASSKTLINWVKSTIMLVKQPILLGKMNPTCGFFYIYPDLRLKTTQIRLILTCFRVKKRRTWCFWYIKVDNKRWSVVLINTEVLYPQSMISPLLMMALSLRVIQLLVYSCVFLSCRTHPLGLPLFCNWTDMTFMSGFMAHLR